MISSAQTIVSNFAPERTSNSNAPGVGSGTVAGGISSNSRGSSFAPRNTAERALVINRQFFYEICETPLFLHFSLHFKNVNLYLTLMFCVKNIIVLIQIDHVIANLYTILKHRDYPKQ